MNENLTFYFIVLAALLQLATMSSWAVGENLDPSGIRGTTWFWATIISLTCSVVIGLAGVSANAYLNDIASSSDEVTRAYKTVLGSLAITMAAIQLIALSAGDIAKSVFKSQSIKEKEPV